MAYFFLDFARTGLTSSPPEWFLYLYAQVAAKMPIIKKNVARDAEKAVCGRMAPKKITRGMYRMMLNRTLPTLGYVITRMAHRMNAIWSI